MISEIYMEGGVRDVSPPCCQRILEIRLKHGSEILNMLQFTNKQLQTYFKIFLVVCGLLFLGFYSVYIVVFLIFLFACVHYCKDWSELTAFHAQVLHAILADCMIWLESTMSSLYKSFQRQSPNTRESGESESIKFNPRNSQYSPRQNSLSHSGLGNNQFSSYHTGSEYSNSRSPNYTRFSSASPSNRSALDVCNRSDIVSKNVSNDEMGYSYKSSPWSKQNTSTSSVVEKHKVKPVQNVGGPLLACSHISSNKSINLRLYADASSPGLAGRSVQYHQEGAENRQPWTITHQSKYKSVGQFPIVKLKSSNQVPKLNLSMSPKAPRTPSLSGGGPSPSLLQSSPIGVSSPGMKIHHTDASVEPHDISARAVIEALKEISRKRIRSQCLSSPDLDDDNAKRQKRGAIEEGGKNNRDATRHQLSLTNNGLLQGKRGRESPPHQDSSSECSLPDFNNTNSGQSRSKKICSNEILSSLSSSRCLLLLAAKNKRKFAISPEGSPRSGTPVPDQSGKHFKASYHDLSKDDNSHDVVDTRPSQMEDADIKINERKMSSNQEDGSEITRNSNSQVDEASDISSKKQLNNSNSMDSVASVGPLRKIVEAEDLEEQRKKDRSALVGLLTVLSRGESPFREESGKPESVKQPELTTATTVVSSSATPTTTPKSQKHVSFAENLISGPTASPLHTADTLPVEAVGTTSFNSPSFTFGSFASTTESPSASLVQTSIPTNYTGSAGSPVITSLSNSSLGSSQKPVASSNETACTTFSPNKSTSLTASSSTLLTPVTSTLSSPNTSTLLAPSTSALFTQNTVMADGKSSNILHVEPVTSTSTSTIQTSTLFSNQPSKPSVVVSSSNQSLSFNTAGNIFAAPVNKATISSGSQTPSSNTSSDSPKFGGLSTLPTSSALNSHPLQSFASSQPLSTTTVLASFNNTNTSVKSTANSFMLPSSTSLTQSSQKPEVANIFSAQSTIPQFGTGHVTNTVSVSNSSDTVGGFTFTSRTTESAPAPIQFGSGLNTESNSADREGFKFSSKPFQFAAAQSKPTGFAFSPTPNATSQMTIENSSILPTSSTIQPSVFSKTTTTSSTTQMSSFSVPTFSSSKSVFGTSDPVKTTQSNIFGSVAQNSQNLFSSSSNAKTSRDSKVSPFGSTSSDKVSPFGSTSSDKVAPFGSTSDKVSPFGSTSSDKVSPFGSTSSDKVSPFGSTSSESTKPQGISELKSAPFTFNSAAAPVSTTAPFTFGSATTITTTAPFTFAAASAPASTGAPFQFGSSTMNKSETVTFGSANVASPTPFAFSSTPSGSQPVAANKTPFQFGGTSTTQSSGGFNFTGASTPAAPVINFSSGSSSTPGLFGTPGVSTPAFGSPGASMFSIGSGSSAPKGRISKTKKRI